jgi:hypothetical protein
MIMKKFGYCFAVLAALGTGWMFASSALARTTYAAFGMAYPPSNLSCFIDNHPGVQNTCSQSYYWEMPVSWDTPTGSGQTRNIYVRGKVDSGFTEPCFYYVWNADGTFGGSGSFTAMSGGGNWGTAQLTGIVVAGGSFAKVMCALPNAKHGTVLGVDYPIP